MERSKAGTKEKRSPDGLNHGGMINRWPHPKTNTLDDVIAKNSTQEINVN